MTNLWVTAEDLGEYAESDYAYDAVKTASFILWALSGRKFSGTTTVTERYVTTFDPFSIAGAAGSYAPMLLDGEMYNVPVGRYGRGPEDDLQGDGTSSNARIRLRGRKVVQIHSMRDMSGEIIDPSEYYLGDHSTIYAAPSARWSPTNVEVSYTYGSPPPTAGKAAARLLAKELVKLYEDDDTCALPQRVTSVARQGVTYTILDDQGFIDQLRTGLYAVDLFLKSTNPDQARARARVFSPDVPRARRITSGKPLPNASSDSDLFVSAHGGTVVLNLADISGEFLLTQSEWVLSATISNWSDSRSSGLLTAPVLSVPNSTITVSATYAETLAILGSIDPGTLDVIATRPHPGNPLINDVVDLVSCNIIIRLGQPVIA